MIATQSAPPILTSGFAELAGSYRLSVEQYHALIEHAILTEDEPVELLGGYVLYKLDHIDALPPSRFYPAWGQFRR